MKCIPPLIAILAAPLLLSSCAVKYRVERHSSSCTSFSQTTAPEQPAVSESSLIDRYKAAEVIGTFSDRDSAMASVARDAVQTGDFDLARQALDKIISYPIHDDTARVMVRSLAEAGRRDEALSVARSITSLSERDAALAELAD